MKGRMLLFFSLLLPLGSAAGQFDSGNIVRQVRVHIGVADGSCDANAEVTLSALNGSVVQGIQNDRCEVEFTGVPEGEYQVLISGEGFANANVNSSIYVSRGGPAYFEIPVRRRNSSGFAGIPANAFVSASDLAVPGRARKELEKANALIRKQELEQAVGKLKKAIAIYPQYALAYNNLGVLYSHLGDQVHEKEALQKAISLNPTFALAYVNVGRMDMSANDYPAAEGAFQKALSLGHKDAITLMLLSYSELMERKLDGAIAMSRAAHALQEPHAFAHRIAARAFEEEKQGPDAIAELEMFLKEAPQSPRAADVRDEIEMVKGTARH